MLDETYSTKILTNFTLDNVLKELKRFILPNELEHLETAINQTKDLLAANPQSETYQLPLYQQEYITYTQIALIAEQAMKRIDGRCVYFVLGTGEDVARTIQGEVTPGGAVTLYYENKVHDLTLGQVLIKVGEGRRLENALAIILAGDM